MPEPNSENSAQKVYFLPLGGDESTASLAAKTRILIEAADCGKLIHERKLVALKQTFGERGSQGYIKPEVTKVVADLVKGKGGAPLLVETNTLYRGARSNSYDHLMLAHEHGFGIENVGAPVAILDGINGQNQHAVAIPGRHFSQVHMVSDLAFFDAIFVLSHVKGHMMAGFGGAVKNLAMGFASRAGKLAQHADFKPEIDAEKCQRCELCGAYCPQDALRLVDNRMQVNLERCVGCGECYIACQSGAISFHWGKADPIFQEKMAEHALGAVIQHRGRCVYLNYFCHVTQHCDCWSDANPVRFPDVGIFASFDPVAIDRACMDAAREKFTDDIFKQFWPHIDAGVQLSHAEKIGLGTQDYELVRVAESAA